MYKCTLIETIYFMQCVHSFIELGRLIEEKIIWLLNGVFKEELNRIKILKKINPIQELIWVKIWDRMWMVGIVSCVIYVLGFKMSKFNGIIGNQYLR